MSDDLAHRLESAAVVQGDRITTLAQYPLHDSPENRANLRREALALLGTLDQIDRCFPAT